VIALRGTTLNQWGKKRSVKRRYDLTADIYEARYAQEQEAKYVAALEGLSLAGAAVLDVGCGSGLFFNQVANDAAMVVGVDVSRKLLILAKHKGKKFPNVVVVQADADLLPFRSGVFSHVFAFTVLQNMPKPAQTLKQLQEVAKGDAFFVVSGLKAAIPVEEFGGFLEAAGLRVTSLVNNDVLRCYVVTCVRP
jgi:ubiquinone/menaquinone biosynthesis C-methylase UbiE